MSAILAWAVAAGTVVLAAGSALRRRRACARFEGLVRLSTEWFWELDSELRFVSIDRGFGEGHWMRLSGCAGHARWESPYGGLGEAERAAFEARLAHREPFRDFELMRPDSGGAMRWVSISGEPLFDAAGRFRGYRGIGRDIHERKLREAALRESEARCRAVLETTSDAVIVADGDNRITFANGAVAALCGWDPDELAGRDLGVLQPERLRAAHGAALAERDASGPVARLAFETVALARDGREFPVELALGEIDLADRRYRVAFLRDISARKRADEALQQANSNLERHVGERTAQLEAANRELESFSYTVAHDLRAPLRAIEGYSRLLEETAGQALEADAQRYLERMRANAAAMTGMIEELLELSRVGRLEVDRRPADLESLAREAAEQLASSYPDARVEVEPMPPVEADPTLLRMVLANLVGNGLKFSSRRADARVRVSAGEAGDEVVVSVADNGVGFDPRHAGKLFGVFQRLHTRSEFEGTGIGLATVARIVARHGGRVWAESRPGEGATFHFSLPRKAAAREAA